MTMPDTPTPAELARLFKAVAAEMRDGMDARITISEMDAAAEALLSLSTITEQRDASDAVVAHLHERFGYIPPDDLAQNIDEAIERHRSRQKAERT